MEFLAKHFEKLILSACLLSILLGTYLVVNGVKASREKIKEQYSVAVREVEGNKILPALDFSKLLAASDCVRDKRVNLAINQLRVDDKKGALLCPKRYVICKRPTCGAVTHISEEKCPFCNQTFDPFKETNPEDDTDRDGIPDLVEQRSGFLNYLDPFDARFDYDHDGFLNIEEYQLQTKMDDPRSFPDLVHLLRIQDVRNIQLPFLFMTVKTLDSSNMEDWKVDFDIGGGRKIQARLNEAIGRSGFVVSAISPDRSNVTVKNQEGTTYQMRERQIVSEQIATVSMRYLLTRNRNEARDRRLFVPMTQKIGSEFTLHKETEEGTIEGYYRILSGTTKDDVRVAKLDGLKGKVLTEHLIPTLDVQRDFSPDPEGGGRGPMMREGENLPLPRRRR